MENNNWLAEQSNQEGLYTICKQTLLSMAPREEPLFAEIFPQYMSLAQQDEVIAATKGSKPFSFAGAEDLLTIILIPLVIEIFNNMLLSYGLPLLKDLKDKLRNNEQIASAQEGGAEASIDEEQLQGVIHKIIDEGEYSVPNRAKFERSLVLAINGYLESSN